MQEAKKTRILIASVLKPVDEPRAFEKIGQTLANNGYEVFIAGADASSRQTVDSISFLSHQVPSRISFSRADVRFKILRAALKLKPDLLIVSTHELLGIGLIYRLLTGRKLIYDVQESYFKNILYTNAFPKILRWPVASLVRFKEMIASLFVSGFILAEKCYEEELSFIGKKYCIAENKARIPEGFERKPDPNSIKLIFTGTLAESTGIFEAIALAKKLHELDSKVSLSIIGYAPLSSVLEKIRSEIKGCSFICLIGGDCFVSHQKIFESIANANFGIINYPSLEHTKNKMPTKLYEYHACGLPFIVSENELWKKSSLATAIDFSDYDPKDVFQQLKKDFQPFPDPESEWTSEEERLLKFIASSLV